MPSSRVVLPLPAATMFAVTPVYRIDGDLVFGLLRDAVIPDPTDEIFTVTQRDENRLDLIAYQVYNSADLWWVIAMVNNIVDPQFGVPYGTRLRIPNLSRLNIAL